MDTISRNTYAHQSSTQNHSAPSSMGNSIGVSGNTISWPSNGWYEVQYASSYNTVSEGGRSATLDPGIYNVINHTTGERFENIHVGHDADSTTDFLKHHPTQSERLLEQRAIDIDTVEHSADDPRPVVPETIYNGQHTVQLEPNETVADTAVDTVVAAGIGGGAAVLNELRNPPTSLPKIAEAAVTGAGLGAISVLSDRTDISYTSDYVPNEMVNQTVDFDEGKNTTTTTQLYQDGTYVRHSYDHNDGSSVTQYQDSTGSLTTTTTTNDIDATNSPQTEVTTLPTGEQITVAISPTGGRVAVRTDPTPSHSNRNSDSETDSNYSSSSSHSTGGLSSGTGDQTSNNPHTA